MIKVILSDFSKVLAFANDESYTGDLNPLHDELKTKPDFKFFDHFRINDDLIGILASRKEHHKVMIFTSGDIQEDPELVGMGKLSAFEKIYKIEDLVDTLPSANKKDPETYKELCKRLGVNPEEVMFIDDNLENIEAAKQAGINAIQYTSNEQVTEDMMKEFH